MSFRPEEVSAILAQELERYEAKLETKSVGSVLSVGDGIARVWGLEDAMAGELIRFPGDVMGMVLNLEEDNVGAVLFGSDKNIKEGDRVTPASIDRRALTGGGRTSSRYAGGCSSKNSQHGIETTRVGTPSASSFCRAPTASCSSEPVAIRIIAGVPVEASARM